MSSLALPQSVALPHSESAFFGDDWWLTVDIRYMTALYLELYACFNLFNSYDPLRPSFPMSLFFPLICSFL